MKRPVRFNPDLHFIAPYSLGQCRQKLKTIGQVANDPTAHCRLYAKTDEGQPFEICTWGYEKEPPHKRSTLGLIKGFLKVRDANSTYVTLYILPSRLLYLLTVLFVVVVVYGCLIVIQASSMLCCASLLCSALVAAFLLALSWQKEQWAGCVKTILDEPKGRVLLAEDGLIERYKGKRNPHHYPAYHTEYFSTDADEKDQTDSE